MKVAVYVRVSTESQNLKNQKKNVLDYCERNKLEVFQVYEEKMSGKKDKRLHFDRLLYDMRRRCFQGIVVYELSRIGRSLPHLFQLMAEFDHRNVKFISTKENIDTSTSQGRLMLNILMILAQYERELISAHTKDTLNQYRKDLDAKGYFITKDGRKVTSLGRPRGSKDKRKRKRGGYYARWYNGGKKIPAKISP